MAASYSKHNRLKDSGIDNSHVAIEGMPVLSEEEARKITQAILAMRGVSQTRYNRLTGTRKTRGSKEKQQKSNETIRYHCIVWENKST